MNKKQDLIQILEKLEPIRNLAPWLKFLVEQWNLEENMLDILINAVTSTVHQVKSDRDRDKMQKWLNIMQKMKDIEEHSKDEDEETLKELDKMVQDF